MNTQTVIVARQHLLSPRIDHLLLPQTSSTTNPADPWDLGPDPFTIRATTITVVLKEILERTDYFHGGIHE